MGIERSFVWVLAYLVRRANILNTCKHHTIYEHYGAKLFSLITLEPKPKRHLVTNQHRTLRNQNRRQTKNHPSIRQPNPTNNRSQTLNHPSGRGAGKRPPSNQTLPQTSHTPRLPPSPKTQSHHHLHHQPRLKSLVLARQPPRNHRHNLPKPNKTVPHRHSQRKRNRNPRFRQDSPSQVSAHDFL